MRHTCNNEHNINANIKDLTNVKGYNGKLIMHDGVAYIYMNGRWRAIGAEYKPVSKLLNS